jgi:nicotinamidase-related amidase
MRPIAILTNDLQYDLVHKNEERKAAVSAFTPSFKAFLEEMRALGCHVFHLQLINRPDDPNAERYNGWLPVQKGTEGAKIIADFNEPRDIIVEKNKDSGFYETTLHDDLQSRNIETVIITGMQTQICVQTTAADAFFRGYNVWVPEDGVVSAQDADKRRALDWLAGYCATVSTTADIVEAIRVEGTLRRKELVTP